MFFFQTSSKLSVEDQSPLLTEVTQIPPTPSVESTGNSLVLNQSPWSAVFSQTPSTSSQNASDIVTQSQSPLLAVVTQTLSTPSVVNSVSTPSVQSCDGMLTQNQTSMSTRSNPAIANSSDLQVYTFWYIFVFALA